MTQTALSWAITETQKAALQVTYPRSQDLPLPSSYPRIHLSQWPSPSFLQVRVKELAVGSVNHCSGLQTISFPSLPPRFPCVPSIQWMLGKRPRSTQTLSWKADDPLWSKDWPSPPCLIPDPGPSLPNCLEEQAVLIHIHRLEEERQLSNFASSHVNCPLITG